MCSGALALSGCWSIAAADRNTFRAHSAHADLGGLYADAIEEGPGADGIGVRITGRASLTDDVVLELALAGAKGWIAGYPNALPVASVQLWELSVAQDLEKALPMYRDLHSLLRWDSKPQFVLAIKLSMDVAGRKGGPCRPPRLPLSADVAASVRKDTERALAHGYR